MKRIINSTLSEKENSIAYIAKELLSNNAVIFNSIWAGEGYIGVINYFKERKDSRISDAWFNKLSYNLTTKCGKYHKDSPYSKINAMQYLSNLMLAGDGMGLANNEIK